MTATAAQVRSLTQESQGGRPPLESQGRSLPPVLASNTDSQVGTPNLEDRLVRDLSTDTLAHVLANRRTRENATPPPALAWEQRERTPEDKAWRFVQWARSIGADEDLVGCCLTTKLRELDYSKDRGAEVLRDVGIDWHPHSAEERLIAVAAEMLAGGWAKLQVRWAIDGLVPSGH